MKKTASRLIMLIGIINLGACTTLNFQKENQGFLIESNGREIRIRDQFLKKLWEEAQKISGIHTDKVPEINYIEFDPKEGMTTKSGRHGTSSYQVSGICKISIYYGGILMPIGYYNQKNAELSLHNVIGHEYIHCLYNYNRISHEKDNHHCRMINTGDLEKLLTFIQKTLDGDFKEPKENSLDNAKYACSQDK